MSFLTKLGLDRHDVRDLAHRHGLRHTAECREWNRNHIEGGRLFTCKCDFFERLFAAIFAEAFAFGPTCRCGGASMERDGEEPGTVYFECRDCGWTWC